MEFFPLSEAALLISLPDEPAAVNLATRIRELAPAWLEDVVPAYATVGVYFGADRVTAETVEDWLKSQDLTPRPPLRIGEGETITIPVCYGRGVDLLAAATHLGLAPDAVIALHISTVFTVHAIGFVPGFPYLGYLPPELCSVPRLASPRVRVESGSVGITGRQTGIYPLARPGGWHLIGQTPLTIVDVADGFFPLRVGDRISFTRIDEVEYHQLHGERLIRPDWQEAT